MGVAAIIFASIASLCGLGLLLVVCWGNAPRQPPRPPHVPPNRLPPA